MDLYQQIGGAVKCRELSTAFYARVAKDPTLRPFFPGKSMKCPIEEFSAFLAQFLGGPSEDAGRRWWLSLQESHQRFSIGAKEGDAWLGLMKETLAEVQLAEPTRQDLGELFDQASAYLVNSGAPVTAAENITHAGIHSRWEQQRELDHAVAAIVSRDLPRVRALVDDPALHALFESNHSVFAHFLGVLLRRGSPEFADYALAILLANPSLAEERYNDRTLLHAAAAAGNLTMVDTLLELGVDPDVLDGGEHTPLYSVANECPEGGPVIRALVQAGAEVDANAGAKRCTALHMAARRDNAKAAATLLDCGANIEARDSLGESPLRRAVNCGQTTVAALLLARGADPHSLGSKGLTPRSAARTDKMRALFQHPL